MAKGYRRTVIGLLMDCKNCKFLAWYKKELRIRKKALELHENILSTLSAQVSYHKKQIQINRTLIKELKDALKLLPKPPKSSK